MNGDTTLDEARAWLRDQAKAKGATCPCCQRFTKINNAPFNKGMAAYLLILLELHRERPGGWFDLRAEGDKRGIGANTYGKLVLFGLAYARQEKGEPGGYRLTEKGQDFALGRITIPRRVIYYDGRVLGFDGPQVHIRDVWPDGERFNYAEMMAYEAGPVGGAL